MSFVPSVPIVFFDLETTTADINTARIVEFGGVRIETDGSRTTLHLLINPGIPIPLESSLVHGITDADVKDSPSFDESVDQILEFFDGANIGGYNSNKFDVPILGKQMEEQGYQFPASPEVQLIDVMNIFKRKQNHKLASAVLFYCEKDLENAHSAIADIEATIEVFEKQLERYPDLAVMEASDLAFYCNYDQLPSLDREGKFGYNDKKEIIYLFGKNNGNPVIDDLSYLNWMISDKCNMSDHVKEVATTIRKNLLNERISKISGRTV